LLWVSQASTVQVARKFHASWQTCHSGSAKKHVKSKLLTITSRSISTLIKTQGVGDLYQIYLTAKRDGVDYNLAYIPADFNMQSKSAFDKAYMNALFKLGYSLGRRIQVGEVSTWMGLVNRLLVRRRLGASDREGVGPFARLDRIVDCKAGEIRP
jgi:hypothetical protein